MKAHTYASVWDAIADTPDTPEQAANLRPRAELMQKIAARVNIATALGCRVRLDLETA